MSVHLLITDKPATSWLAQIQGGQLKSGRVRILPLGSSGDRYHCDNAHALDGRLDWSVVDPAELASEARAVLRQGVPTLLLDVQKCPVEGTRPLVDVLQDEHFNAWWFLEMAEKSAYRGPYIGQLYAIALVQTLLKRERYTTVWLCVGDPVLAEVIAAALDALGISCVLMGRRSKGRFGAMISGLWRYAQSAVGIALLHWAQLLLMRLLRVARAEGVTSDQFLLFTFYPRMWTRPYEQDGSDWFFGALPEFFPAQQPARYAVWLTTGPLEMVKHRKDLKDFFRRRGAVSLQLQAGFTGVTSLLAPRWWVLHAKLPFLWRRRLQVSFAGWNVGPIVEEELRRSLSSRELFRDMLIHTAWRNVTASARPAGVLYRLEFQPFESAIVAGVRDRVRTVAYMHPLVGVNYLPYFFAPGELEWRDPRERIPLPDVIVASGEFGREAMIGNGYPKGQVEICGPVRQQRLAHHERSRVPGRSGDGGILVVATAVCREEAEGLFDALQACGEVLDGLDVHYKSHPALPMEKRFVETVGRGLPPSRWRVLTSTEELYRSLSGARAVVLNHSTVALEALTLGALPVIFESGVVFDPKIMEPHEVAGLVVQSAGELRAMLLRIFEEGEDFESLRKKWAGLSTRWFDVSDRDPCERFIEALRNHGFLGAPSA